jgi:DUF4097 and DUF4098 domain-containing protein YvlB
MKRPTRQLIIRSTKRSSRQLMTWRSIGRLTGLTFCLALVGLPSAWAEDRAVATAAAPRGVTVRLETTSGDVEVVRNSEQKVVVEVDDDEDDDDEDGQVPAVRLVPRDKNVLEVTFGGGWHLHSGQVRLRVPAGTGLDVRTQSGDILVRDLGGVALLRSLSGDISLTGAVGADVRTVSGDTSVEGVGDMRVKTVSGDMEVREVKPGSVPRIVVELESTSGDIRWSGGCLAGCKLHAATVSGDVRLALDPRSSFRFTLQSHSGELDDELGMQVTRSSNRRRGVDLEGRFGKGDGSIDCRTFSGDARLIKR